MCTKINFYYIDTILKNTVADQLNYLNTESLSKLWLLIYHKVASKSTSRLVKHPRTEGEIWCLCTVTFGPKSLKLNNRLVYCSRLYGNCDSKFSAFSAAFKCASALRRITVCDIFHDCANCYRFSFLSRGCLLSKYVQSKRAICSLWKLGFNSE